MSESGTARALKVAAMGGPVAVALVAAGSVLVLMEVNGFTTPQRQGALGVLGAILVVLGFVEWAIARRFHEHEKVERRDRQELAERIQRAGQAYIDSAMSQIESVGTRYDTVYGQLSEVIEDVRQRGPRILALEERLERVESQLRDLADLRRRLSMHVGQTSVPREGS